MANAGTGGLALMGFDDLLVDVANMAERLGDVKTLQAIASKGAEPIFEEIKNKTPRLSGRTLEAEKTNDIKPVRGRGRVFMGPTRKAMGVGSDKNDYYPIFVEYGHGGPYPAKEHPWLRPAFDAKADEAYEIVREELGKELDARKLR